MYYSRAPGGKCGHANSDSIKHSRTRAISLCTFPRRGRPFKYTEYMIRLRWITTRIKQLWSGRGPGKVTHLFCVVGHGRRVVALLCHGKCLWSMQFGVVYALPPWFPFRAQIMANPTLFPARYTLSSFHTAFLLSVNITLLCMWYMTRQRAARCPNASITVTYTQPCKLMTDGNRPDH